MCRIRRGFELKGRKSEGRKRIKGRFDREKTEICYKIEKVTQGKNEVCVQKEMHGGAFEQLWRTEKKR